MGDVAKSKITELLERNKILTTTHQAIPTFAELGTMGVDMPHYVVITCADPRCHPEAFLSLSPTDGVVIIRNIGGHVTPSAINDILALDVFLGLTDVMVIHHTDCGTTHFKDAGIRDGLKARLPTEMHGDIEEMNFGAIDDLEQSVKDDLSILKSSALIRKELADRCVGFLYDLKSGALTSVNV